VWKGYDQYRPFSFPVPHRTMQSHLSAFVASECVSSLRRYLSIMRPFCSYYSQKARQCCVLYLRVEPCICVANTKYPRNQVINLTSNHVWRHPSVSFTLSVAGFKLDSVLAHVDRISVHRVRWFKSQRYNLYCGGDGFESWKEQGQHM
jgi:hypothetical protein